MARADFRHKKTTAVPVYPIFKIPCSRPGCPAFVRAERAENGRNLDGVKIVSILRRAGWRYDGFGFAFCPACRHRPDLPTHELVEIHDAQEETAWVEV